MAVNERVFLYGPIVGLFLDVGCSRAYRSRCRGLEGAEQMSWLIAIAVVALFIGGSLFNYQMLYRDWVRTLGDKSAQEEKGMFVLIGAILGFFGPLGWFASWCIGGMPFPKLPKFHRKPHAIISVPCEPLIRNATQLEVAEEQVRRYKTAQWMD